MKEHIKVKIRKPMVWLVKHHDDILRLWAGTVGILFVFVLAVSLIAWQLPGPWIITWLIIALVSFLICGFKCNLLVHYYCPDCDLIFDKTCITGWFMDGYLEPSYSHEARCKACQKIITTFPTAESKSSQAKVDLETLRLKACTPQTFASATGYLDYYQTYADANGKTVPDSKTIDPIDAIMKKMGY